MEIPALGRINITNNPPDINNLTDWERVKSMGDLEIEANALSDPDALPFVMIGKMRRLFLLTIN
jgi:hypothetical protein